MFLIDAIAQFGSREINVKAYTRIINGKAVPVKGARRTVLAIKDALNDLRKITRDNNEGAYLMNPRTGKVGQYVQGNKSSVQSTVNVTTGLQRSKRDVWDLRSAMHNIVRKNYVLHNHPDNSALSPGDLFNSFHRGMNFNVNTSGDIFRAKPNWQAIIPDREHIQKGYIGEKLATRNLEAFTEMNNNLFQKIYKITDKLDNKLNYDNKRFLTSHLYNTLMAKDGLTTYRAKLTEKSKNLVNKYKPILDEITKDYQNKKLYAAIDKNKYTKMIEKVSFKNATSQEKHEILLDKFDIRDYNGENLYEILKDYKTSSRLKKRQIYNKYLNNLYPDIKQLKTDHDFATDVYSDIKNNFLKLNPDVDGTLVWDFTKTLKDNPNLSKWRDRYRNYYYNDSGYTQKELRDIQGLYSPYIYAKDNARSLFKKLYRYVK